MRRSTLRRVMAFPFTLEMLFVAFLFAGRFKGDERFAWIPVDLTLLFFGLTIVGAVITQLQHGAYVSRRGLVVVGVMLLFVTWMAITLIWSPSRTYGMQKVGLMGTVVLWSMTVAAVFIGPSPERTRRFITALIIFGLWTALETAMQIRAGGFGWFLETFGSDSITLSSTLSLTLLLLFVRTIYMPANRVKSILSVVTMLVLLALVLGSGGRGPLVALFLSLVFYAIVLMVARLRKAGLAARARRRMLASLGVVLAGLVIAAPTLIESRAFITLTRLSMMLTMEGGGESANSRLVLSRESLRHWAEAPIVGRGAGSFGVLFDDIDMRAYPHNIIAEILGEFGLIGLGLFAAVVLTALMLARTRVNYSDELFVSVAVMLSFAFLSAQVSGDIADNRPIFMSLGLLAGLPRQNAPPPAAEA